MIENVMNGKLILRKFQPFYSIPAEKLPVSWRPGSSDPQFTDGLPLNQLGLASSYHSRVGRIASYHPDTGIDLATGFIIHPRIVLTAAHVVFNNDQWKEIVLFQPAFNNGKPLNQYEKVTVNQAFIPVDYFGSSAAGYDYAILVLNEALPIRLGAYGFKRLSENGPFPINGFLIGYPSSNGYTKQITEQDFITWVAGSRLGNTISASRGYSGGAIMIKPLNKPFLAVGVHNKQSLASLASPSMMERINYVKNNL